MSAGGYKYISWNPNKIAYDVFLVAGVAAYIFVFTKLGPAWWADDVRINMPIIRIRAWGSCAFLMLTVVLCIGPLARLDRRFLPLLYNRRHFGVLTFLVALWHVQMVLDWYYSYGAISSVLGALLANQYGAYTSLSGFAFEALGLGALTILALMAVTSHDFWLKFMSAPVWKALHMLVYVAYALLIAHVALGALQSESSPWLVTFVVASVVAVVGLHLVSALAESRVDGELALAAGSAAKFGVIPVDSAPEGSFMEPWSADTAPWVDAGTVDDIENNRARIISLAGGERVAVFRYDGKISALHNACAHQNGPLGEGRIINGCVTCPWHGFEYRPEDGRSPPPFDEKVPTYRVRLEGRRILLDPRALPPGTPVEPAIIEPAATGYGAVA